MTRLSSLTQRPFLRVRIYPAWLPRWRWCGPFGRMHPCKTSRARLRTRLRCGGCVALSRRARAWSVHYRGGTPARLCGPRSAKRGQRCHSGFAVYACRHPKHPIPPRYRQPALFRSRHRIIRSKCRAWRGDGRGHALGRLARCGGQTARPKGVFHNDLADRTPSRGFDPSSPWLCHCAPNCGTCWSGVQCMTRIVKITRRKSQGFYATGISCPCAINLSATFCREDRWIRELLQCNVTRDSRCAAMIAFIIFLRRTTNEFEFTPAGAEEKAPKTIWCGGGFATQQISRLST